MNLVSREKAIDVAIDEYNRGYKEGFEAGKASVSGDGDLISRQAAIDALERIFDRCEEIEVHLPEGDPDRTGYKMYPDYMTVWEYLHTLSSAPPEIIRCKDCKHYDGRPCGIVDWYNTADDFCSRAERRTDG